MVGEDLNDIESRAREKYNINNIEWIDIKEIYKVHD